MRSLVFSIFLASTAIAQQISGSPGVVAQGKAATAADPVNRVVSLRFTNTKVEDALREIARQSDVVLRYKKNALPAAATVTFAAEKISAVNAVRRVLKDTGVEIFVETNGAITLIPPAKPAAGKGQGTIAGKVTDAKTGKGIAGANVSVGNDVRGVTTGEEGTYRLTGIGSGTHVITVRLLGYAKQSRSVTLGDGATVTVDFRIEPSANVLDQVVVTGTIAKTELKAVPNAITVVTARQIEERGITRIDQLFRGEIPGLYALQSGASSAGGIEVIMFSRGATNINTESRPQFITNPIKTYVDGVELADPMYLSQIDPKSIERIEILTGPQASTIYGANAINGVMQIFTKRGSGGRPQLTLNLFEGFTENNFSSSMAIAHRYDASASGTEGRLSYNIGSGWNYAGAWTPAIHSQQVSGYGGTRYQVGALSVDASARQGWGRHKQLENGAQVYFESIAKGTFNSTTPGIAPNIKTFNTRTLGLTVDYSPVSWWSHRVTLGGDEFDDQVIRGTIGFAELSDTLLRSGQSSNKRTSQSYASTLRLPISSMGQAILSYGADHWRTMPSSLSWLVIPPSPQIVESNIIRTRPYKNSGGYVQGQFGFWDELFLTYGVRADFNPDFGDKVKVHPGRYGASYSKDFGNISAKVRGAYGRSIRPPGRGQIQGQLNPYDFYNQIYGGPLYENLSNPDLGPEFQQGGEAGMELYLGNRGSLIVTRYNQTVDRLIYQLRNVDSVPSLLTVGESYANAGLTCTDYTSQSVCDGYTYFQQHQYINAGSIRNQGWELQGSITTGPFTTSSTYSWTKSRVIGITPRYRSLLVDRAFIPGQTFDFIPEHTGALSVSYAQHATSVSLNVSGSGTTSRPVSQTDLDRGTASSIRLRMRGAYKINSIPDVYRQPVAGYATANMNATHRFSDRISTTLQISNLADYYRNDVDIYYPTPGRQTNIGLSLRW